MRKSNLVLAGLAGLLLCSTALAGPQPDIGGDTINQFKAATTAFQTSIGTYARWLFGAFVTIDVGLMLLSKVIQGEGAEAMLTALMMRVKWYGFTLFLMSGTVIPAIINGFRQIGEQASGVSIVSPGDIFWQGIDIVMLLMSKFADNANIGGVPVPAGMAAAANPLVALIVGLSIIMILLAYLVMMAQYVLLLVQMYFMMAVSPLVFSVAALKQGRDIGIKPLSSALVMGVKFLALYFVMAVAKNMSAQVETMLANFSIIDLSPMFAVLGLAGLLAFLALKTPTMAGDILNGSVSLAGGDAVAAGAVAGGAVAAVASGGASVAGGAMNSVRNAAQAGGAAIENARAMGATGVGGVAAGAARALGGASIEAAGGSIKSLASGSGPGPSIAERISAKTANVNEAKAAGASPAAGGVSAPAAPAAPTTSGSPAAPAAPTASGSPAAPTTPAALGSPPAPSTPAASGGPPAPPTPAPEGSPAVPSAPDSLADAAKPAPGPDSGGTSGGSISGAEQPAVPSTANNLASNLMNELKQADNAQAVSVPIQTTHE